MSRVAGYLPFTGVGPTAEAGFLQEAFGCSLVFPRLAPELNGSAPPDLDLACAALAPLRELPHVFAEGPGGLLAGAVLRSRGFRGKLTLIPYLNPHRFEHLAAARWYAGCADPRDTVWLGSPRSAALWRALGVPARVGEPFGIDGARFRPAPGADAVRARLGLPQRGPLLLYAGRVEPDKDVARLLRVALQARLLFPELSVVLATHRIAPADADALRYTLGPEAGVHLVRDPAPDDLADLYRASDVFATAATSALETFGRAPAEALSCGTPAVAPDFDGFAHVLDQPGGHLVPLAWRDAEPALPEERLLRAVYDVLSAPRPVDREAIAAAAARFHRARTLERLAVAFEPEPGPPEPLPAVPFRVPPDHAAALSELPAVPGRAALRGPWPDPAPLVAAVRCALGDGGCR